MLVGFIIIGFCLFISWKKLSNFTAGLTVLATSSISFLGWCRHASFVFDVKEMGDLGCLLHAASPTMYVLL